MGECFTEIVVSLNYIYILRVLFVKWKYWTKLLRVFETIQKSEIQILLHKRHGELLFHPHLFIFNINYMD